MFEARSGGGHLQHEGDEREAVAEGGRQERIAGAAPELPVILPHEHDVLGQPDQDLRGDRGRVG